MEQASQSKSSALNRRARFPSLAVARRFAPGLLGAFARSAPERIVAPTRASPLLQILVREIPVRQVPEERLDVLRPRVPEIDVIRMLPDIEREQRLLAVLHREI